MLVVCTTQYLSFFVRRDGHTLPANLQSKDQRGYGVTGLLVRNTFILAFHLLTLFCLAFFSLALRVLERNDARRYRIILA